MRRILAILFMGVSIAVPGAMAFAGEPGTNSVDHQKFPEPAFVRAVATTTGTTAGPSQPLPVWVQMRDDNFGH